MCLMSMESAKYLELAIIYYLELQLISHSHNRFLTFTVSLIERGSD